MLLYINKSYYVLKRDLSKHSIISIPPDSFEYILLFVCNLYHITNKDEHHWINSICDILTNRYIYGNEIMHII